MSREFQTIPTLLCMTLASAHNSLSQADVQLPATESSRQEVASKSLDEQLLLNRDER